ncbi:GTPase [Zoogloea sp.]|uniref:GTPase n=1 Tax=Zoogloea sp. TaxID=49181 RepID=UPI0035B08A6A
MANNMNTNAHQPTGIDFSRLAQQLPGMQGDIQRLQTLCRGSAELPVVMVLGKYNHGKSSLLNALVGQPDRFGVADCRKTTEVEHCDAGGVRWVDTPGLDADVAGTDDTLALTAARARADVRLLVHSLQEGELDQAELTLAHKLLEEERQTGRALLVVLTQRDQMSDASVVAAIREQLPQTRMVAEVSANSYVRGIAENKPALKAFSGFEAFRTVMAELLGGIQSRKAREKQALLQRLDAGLAKLETEARKTLVSLQEDYQHQLASYEAAMISVEAQIMRKFMEAQA